MHSRQPIRPLHGGLQRIRRSAEALAQEKGARTVYLEVSWASQGGGKEWATTVERGEGGD
jgi:hypothetical protein